VPLSQIVGAALMATIGTISVISSTFTIFTILWFRLYRTKPHRLILALCFADILQGTAGAMSWRWIGLPILAGGECTFQGIMFSLGDVSSSLWADTICIYSVMFGAFNKDSKYFELVAHIFCWGVSIIFCFVGFGIPRAGEPPFFGKAGVWCWVDPYYGLERIFLHYFWIALVLLLLVILYGYMGFKLNNLIKNSLSLETNKQSKHLKTVLRKLAGYPIVYFFVFMPLAIDRFLRVFDVNPPLEYLIFSICLFVSNGFCNSTVYFITRKVYKKYFGLFVKGTKMDFSEGTGTGTGRETSMVELTMAKDSVSSFIAD